MLEEIEIFTILMVDFKSFMDRRSFFVHVDLNVELNNEEEYGQSNWEAS